MTSFRSRRLEAVFGMLIDSEMSYDAIAALKTTRVTEAADLEYKKERYDNRETAKRDLCVDITALANAGGGVILLGIEEDDHAAVKDLVHVDLSDEEVRRIRSIAASGIAPLPAFDVFPVATPTDPSKGIVVVAVPQSPMRPHAVLVNEGLRYPVRHGSGITYLSEAEVADAYRRRSRRAEEGAAALERIEKQLLAQFHGQDVVYLAVSLVPDVPGFFPLDTAAFRAFKQELGDSRPGFLDKSLYWERHRVAGGRLVAFGGKGEKPRFLGCELYRDGSGAFAKAVGYADEANRLQFSPNTIYLPGERVIDAIWSGASFLARHAQARAGVGGNASVRVTIAPVLPGRPAQLYRRDEARFPELIGFPVDEAPHAEGLFDIADLTDAAPPLVTATYGLATELFQEFGLPEAIQMTAAGIIRTRHWSPDYRPELIAWTNASGIQTTEDMVEGA